MEITEEHKKEVETKLVETIADALEKNLISTDNQKEISDFILSRMPSIKTYDELTVFLRELSAKWQIFTPLLTTEAGEVKEKAEEKVAEKVEDLTQAGKIEEALETAKAATDTLPSQQ